MGTSSHFHFSRNEVLCHMLTHAPYLVLCRKIILTKYESSLSGILNLLWFQKLHYLKVVCLMHLYHQLYKLCLVHATTQLFHLQTSLIPLKPWMMVVQSLNRPIHTMIRFGLVIHYRLNWQLMPVRSMVLQSKLLQHMLHMVAAHLIWTFMNLHRLL